MNSKPSWWNDESEHTSAIFRFAVAEDDPEPTPPSPAPDSEPTPPSPAPNSEPTPEPAGDTDHILLEEDYERWDSVAIMGGEGYYDEDWKYHPDQDEPRLDWTG